MTAMIDRTAVAEVAALAREGQTAAGRTLEIDGVTFSTTQLHPVLPPKQAEPKALAIHTLTGIAEYVRANRDKLALGDCILHVAGPSSVVLYGHLTGQGDQRLAYIHASTFDRFAAVPTFQFGRFVGTEDMIVALQALFADTPGRGTVLRLLGNVKNEQVQTQADDGVTQTVTARAGVALVTEVAVPNPVLLSPFRTFAEVTQPESPFVLRVKRGNCGVEAALFEADGGAWRLAAIEEIAEWLKREDLAVAVVA